MASAGAGHAPLVGSIQKHCELFKEFHGLQKEIIHIAEDLFSSGRQEGAFKTTLPNATLGQFFSSLMFGVMIGWKMNGSVGDWAAASETVVRFILDGCKSNS